MFLKKIKIDGFKSFAEPVIIDFDSPLIAIVGPNGSGKSNIVDAIRWALGEQSAKNLRGSTMADVIFAGSDEHHPLKRASVTLYLDNSNGVFPRAEKEIRICRKVSNDGQSNYFLNGSSCRRKDIEELLLDTGLGKHTYSIVGQGKIDSILNSKPEKLRELFEEAAGISKHKLRKEEAQKRLQETSQDLQRVSDLIWELKKQLKPLEKAAEKAKIYQRLKTELRELELSLLLAQWDSQQEKLEQNRREREDLQYKIERLKQDLQQNTQVLEEKKREVEDKQVFLEELKSNFYQSRARKEELENRTAILKEREKGLEKERDNYHLQLAEAEKEVASIKEAGAEVKEKLFFCQEKEQELIKLIQQQEAKLSQYKERILAFKKALNQQRNLIFTDNGELQDLISELDKSRERSNFLGLEIEKMAQQQKELNRELDANLLAQDEKKRDLAKLKVELKGSARILEEIKDGKRKYHEELASLEESLSKLNNLYNQKSSRLKLLKELEEDYRGYYQGVKVVLTNQERFQGIIGIVADQIKVAPQYERAIETALGSRLQNIIVRDDQVAQEIVAFLKKKQGGRATFLPLNLVGGKKAQVSQLEKVEGFLGIAADFLEYDQSLTGVINYLLGRTLLTSDLKAAALIARQTGSMYKIVTLAGDVINPGGAITGGSNKLQQSSLLSRAREIAKLKSELKDLKEKINSQLAQKEESLCQLKTLEQKESDLKKKSSQLELREKELQQELATLKELEYKLNTDLEKKQGEFIQVHDQLGSLDAKIGSLEQRIQLINQDFSNEKAALSEKEQQIEEMEQAEEELKQLLTKDKIELARIREKLSLYKNEENSLTEKLVLNREKIRYYQGELEKLKEKLAKLREDIQELSYTKENCLLENKQLEEMMQTQMLEFQSLKNSLLALEKKDRDYQEKFNQFRDAYHQLELKITRLEDRRQQIQERLKDEYEVDPLNSNIVRIKIDNFQQASQKVKEFKSALKKLGKVNPGAIDEYQQLKERLEFLLAQQQDLKGARDSILSVIAEIEKTMGGLFKKTFEAVKIEFENIFINLFSGGKAELKLTNEEDLLHTGVEITAQPPGKQLKKLSLMSGGERALTAIALVFAFLRVNPSPIYILDEIDAPLDDANVKRFASFLKKYSQEVQFMLITHNKNMMLEASSIYGITMEQSGISKIVSLNLDEVMA